MNPEAERQKLSIVLRGSFNPSIFQPSWLAKHDLIREEEAENADINIIHPEVVQFSVDWLRVQVKQNRFHLETGQEAYHETLRDLAASIFDLVTHTPLRVLGINWSGHFRLSDEEEYNELGYDLVPRQNWEDVLEEPGMISLTVEGRRRDDYNGHVWVKTEPSREFKNSIFIDINDHYQFVESSSERTIAAGDSPLEEILMENWNSSREQAEQIFEHILSLTDQS